MIAHISPHDIANTVRMASSVRGVVFVLVEGQTDVNLFASFTSRTSDFQVCHDRSIALHAVALLEGDATGHTRFLAVVDADFDYLERRDPPSPNCVRTDHRDVEILLLCSTALDKVLREKGSSDKIDAFERERGRSVREAVFDVALPIGYLRWLNHRDGLELKFRDLDFTSFVSKGMTLDEQRLAGLLAQRSPGRHDPAHLLKASRELASVTPDPRIVCSGHDACAILCIGLRRELGSLQAQQTRRPDFERELRLAFDWDCFEKTALCDGIRAWERANPGLRVLASRNP